MKLTGTWEIARRMKESLKWAPPLRAGSYFILRSECGRYSVHAEKIDGKWRYEALTKPQPDIPPCEVLGWVWTKEEAIALCDAHAIDANELPADAFEDGVSDEEEAT